jgi:hypothetical protein
MTIKRYNIIWFVDEVNAKGNDNLSILWDEVKVSWSGFGWYVKGRTETFIYNKRRVKDCYGNNLKNIDYINIDY